MAFILFVVVAMQASNDNKKQGVVKLHKTVYRGDVDEAKRLIYAGVSVNAEASNKTTPLHAAAKLGRMNMVKLFIKHGADFGIKDAYGVTARGWAAQNEHTYLFKLLNNLGKLKKDFNKTSNKKLFWRKVRKNIAQEHIDLFALNQLRRYLLKRYGATTKQIDVIYGDNGVEKIYVDGCIDDDGYGWVVLDLTEDELYEIVKYLSDRKIKLDNIKVTKQIKEEPTEESIKDKIINKWSKIKGWWNRK